MERLTLDSGDHTLSLDFHRRLTVVGGVDPRSREALADELLDALGGGRNGVRLDVRWGGRALTVLRPANRPHTVVDTDDDVDVTSRHLDPGGSVDLLAAAGVDRALARSVLRLTADALSAHRDDETWVTRLAAVDQATLWNYAHDVRSTERELENLSDTTGTTPGDLAVLEVVEERHRLRVVATESYERARLVALTLSAVGIMAGVTIAADDASARLLPLAAAATVALVGIVLALMLRSRVGRAEAAERAALAEVGADDYLSFHRRRVADLLDSDRDRRRLMIAVGDHHRAVAGWETLAGEIPVAFAVNHEPQVRAAAGLRARALEHAPGRTDPVARDVAAPLAQAVLARFDAVEALGTRREGWPLVVDDAFSGLDTGVLHAMLELVESQSSRIQVIVFTADHRVGAWAREIDDPTRLGYTEPQLSVDPTRTAPVVTPS